MIQQKKCRYCGNVPDTHLNYPMAKIKLHRAIAVQLIRALRPLTTNRIRAATLELAIAHLDAMEGDATE